MQTIEVLCPSLPEILVAYKGFVVCVHYVTYYNVLTRSDEYVNFYPELSQYANPVRLQRLSARRVIDMDNEARVDMIRGLIDSGTLRPADPMGGAKRYSVLLRRYLIEERVESVQARFEEEAVIKAMAMSGVTTDLSLCECLGKEWEPVGVHSVEAATHLQNREDEDE